MSEIDLIENIEIVKTPIGAVLVERIGEGFYTATRGGLLRAGRTAQEAADTLTQVFKSMQGVW